MEFRFNINEIFKQPIVQVGSTLIPQGFKGDRRTLWDAVGKVTDVVNAMGTASAAAQGLTKPITSADRLRNSENQQLYLLIDPAAYNGKGAVTGLLKTGQKGLYVFDRDGHHYHVQSPCVLDFYVHESRQRSGHGKTLFEHMLQKEAVVPEKLAIDRPSEKFLEFLKKHYDLQSPIRQMNNYVVYDGFFPDVKDTDQLQSTNNNSSSPNKNMRGSNGLQQQIVTSPYGRYGAPRPACSMGQIIHNQSAAVSPQEPTGLNIRVEEPRVYQRGRTVANAVSKQEDCGENVVQEKVSTPPCPKVAVVGNGLGDKGPIPIVREEVKDPKQQRQEYYWPFAKPAEEYPSIEKHALKAKPCCDTIHELISLQCTHKQPEKPQKIPIDERGQPIREKPMRHRAKTAHVLNSTHHSSSKRMQFNDLLGNVDKDLVKMNTFNRKWSEPLPHVQEEEISTIEHEQKPVEITEQNTNITDQHQPQYHQQQAHQHSTNPNQPQYYYHNGQYYTYQPPNQGYVNQPQQQTAANAQTYIDPRQQVNPAMQNQQVLDVNQEASLSQQQQQQLQRQYQEQQMLLQQQQRLQEQEYLKQQQMMQQYYQSQQLMNQSQDLQGGQSQMLQGQPSVVCPNENNESQAILQQDRGDQKAEVQETPRVVAEEVAPEVGQGEKVEDNLNVKENEMNSKGEAAEVNTVLGNHKQALANRQHVLSSQQAFPHQQAYSAPQVQVQNQQVLYEQQDATCQQPIYNSQLYAQQQTYPPTYMNQQVTSAPQQNVYGQQYYNQQTVPSQHQSNTQMYNYQQANPQQAMYSQQGSSPNLQKTVSSQKLAQKSASKSQIISNPQQVLFTPQQVQYTQNIPNSQTATNLQETPQQAYAAAPPQMLTNPQEQMMSNQQQIIQQTVPSPTQNQMLSSQQQVLPNSQQQMLPNNQQQVLSNSQQQVFPNSQQVLPNSQQQVLPNNQQVWPNGQQQVLPNTQQQVLTNTQQSVPPKALSGLQDIDESLTNPNMSNAGYPQSMPMYNTQSMTATPQNVSVNSQHVMNQQQAYVPHQIVLPGLSKSPQTYVPSQQHLANIQNCQQQMAYNPQNQQMWNNQQHQYNLQSQSNVCGNHNTNANYYQSQINSTAQLSSPSYIHEQNYNRQGAMQVRPELPKEPLEPLIPALPPQKNYDAQKVPLIRAQKIVCPPENSQLLVSSTTKPRDSRTAMNAPQEVRMEKKNVPLSVNPLQRNISSAMGRRKAAGSFVEKPIVVETCGKSKYNLANARGDMQPMSPTS